MSIMVMLSYLWPFVMGLHWSTMDSPKKEPVVQSFNLVFDVRLNKMLNKQSSRRWLVIILTLQVPKDFTHDLLSFWRKSIHRADIDSTWDQKAGLSIVNILSPDVLISLSSVYVLDQSFKLISKKVFSS